VESIHQVAAEIINKILDIDITQGLTPSLAEMKQHADELIREVAKHKLEALDQALVDNRKLRRGWIVEHKDVPRSLLTGHGLLQYKRRYYRNGKTGQRRYLVDDLAGIEKYERIEVGLTAQLCEAAVDNSYAKSSKLCSGGEVSRQTVMSKTRNVHSCKLKPIEPRTDVREIHLQADEDHVAMQDGRRDTIVKLVAIHEPVRREGQKRIHLPQRHLMTSYKEPVEDFWLRVADEIDRRYGDIDRLKIYIHGDGAGWIRSGTKWIKNSRFVLDKFHVSQLVNRVTGGDPDYREYIWKQMAQGSRQKIYELTQACIDSGVCVENTGKTFQQYIRNNWDGIQIWYDKGHNAGSSCAEGLVSHVLSSRLSSRPCGWLDEGLETISRLRVHVLNGGRILPENVRQARKPAIRATKALQKAISVDERFEINGAGRLHTCHRTSSSYRLFNAIANGGMVI